MGPRGSFESQSAVRILRDSIKGGKNGKNRRFARITVKRGMKLMVAFNLLVAFFCVHLASSAPLRLLRIRNMTFLFVESSDGERVEILYAPTGRGLGSFPVGQLQDEGGSALKNEHPAPKDDVSALKNDGSALKNDNSVLRNDVSALQNDVDPEDYKSDDEEPYDPELDAPRVGPSLIQAPKFRSPCDSGHKADKYGKCRRIW